MAFVITFSAGYHEKMQRITILKKKAEVEEFYRQKFGSIPMTWKGISYQIKEA